MRTGRGSLGFRSGKVSSGDVRVVSSECVTVLRLGGLLMSIPSLSSSHPPA